MKKQFLTTSPFMALKARFHFITWMPLLLFVFLYTSCKKPDLKEEQGKLAMQTMNGETLSINMNDIYAKLPLTILHNTGSIFKLNEEETQWLTKGDSLVVRVPVSVPGNAYLYAVKTQRSPQVTNVYLVQLNREAGSSESSFTGTQDWLDLQTWTIYGKKFENGNITKGTQPENLATGGGWEECMLQRGYFYMQSDGQIDLRDQPINQQTVGAVTTMDDDNCHELLGDPKQGIWTRIGNIFRGAANLIITSTPYEYGSGSGGGGGGWIWPINWNQGGAGPGGVGGGPVNGIGSPANSDVALLKGALGLNELEVLWLNQHLDIANEMEYFLMEDYINCTCGLTQTNRKGIIRDHLTMMMQNPDYVTKINNLTGNWWDRDQNGVVEARKIQMEITLQSKPFSLLNCNELSQIPSAMTQDVGSYQIPLSVMTRINTLRNMNSPTYTTNNFNIQSIVDAHGGVVNCDYFFIKINSFPLVNNVPMTAPEFLEYFRTHISNFIEPNIDVIFSPYIHYIAGSVNINESSKFNSSYENSLGSLVHIDMLDDGTVIESGYTQNTGTNHYYFTFTTMETPLDYAHPVAGNRRFGVFSSAGEYYFYILGVDRTNDYSTTIANSNLFGNQAFSGADALWRSIQHEVIDYIESNHGNAFMAEERIARPKWTYVKNFLLGKLTFPQLKSELGCP